MKQQKIDTFDCHKKESFNLILNRKYTVTYFFILNWFFNILVSAVCLECVSSVSAVTRRLGDISLSFSIYFIYIITRKVFSHSTGINNLNVR